MAATCSYERSERTSSPQARPLKRDHKQIWARNGGEAASQGGRGHCASRDLFTSSSLGVVRTHPPPVPYLPCSSFYHHSFAPLSFSRKGAGDDAMTPREREPPPFPRGFSPSPSPSLAVPWALGLPSDCNPVQCPQQIIALRSSRCKPCGAHGRPRNWWHGGLQASTCIESSARRTPRTNNGGFARMLMGIRELPDSSSQCANPGACVLLPETVCRASGMPPPPCTNKRASPISAWQRATRERLWYAVCARKPLVWVAKCASGLLFGSGALEQAHADERARPQALSNDEGHAEMDQPAEIRCASTNVFLLLQRQSLCLPRIGGRRDVYIGVGAGTGAGGSVASGFFV